MENLLKYKILLKLKLNTIHYKIHDLEFGIFCHGRTAGCSITVVRVHGVHVARVQFPAARPDIFKLYGYLIKCNIKKHLKNLI